MPKSIPRAGEITETGILAAALPGGLEGLSDSLKVIYFLETQLIIGWSKTKTRFSLIHLTTVLDFCCALVKLCLTVTPWTAAHQASLPLTISWILGSLICKVLWEFLKEKYASYHITSELFFWLKLVWNSTFENLSLRRSAWAQLMFLEFCIDILKEMITLVTLNIIISDICVWK